MRPRLSRSDLEIIAKALDLYINHLKNLTKNRKAVRFAEQDEEMKTLRQAKKLRVHIERNLRGKRGRMPDLGIIPWYIQMTK